MVSLGNDSHGRPVTMDTADGQDTYTVIDPGTQATFSVSFRSGISQDRVMSVINSMPVSSPSLGATQIYTAVIQSAMAFGQALSVQLAVSNIMMGITQAGKSQALLAYTADLYHAVTTGSLYVAIDIINTMIADTGPEKSNLSPFITNTNLTFYKNQIQDFLNLPHT